MPSATVGGGGDLVVTDPSGARLAAIPAGEQWRVVPSGIGVSVQPPGRIGSTPSEMIAIIAADPAGLVRVNGRTYRGIVEIVRDTAGITLVNRLPLETYLLGVVSAEMGRRNLAEFEALKAQAVVSRTYALRNLGRRARARIRSPRRRRRPGLRRRAARRRRRGWRRCAPPAAWC